MNELAIKIAVPTLTAFFGALITWLFNRHRSKREDERLDKATEAQSITNIDAATKTWQKVVDALEKQIAKLLSQRQEDAERIERLSCKIIDLQEKIDDLQNRLRLTEKLERKVNRYEKLLDAHGIAY